MARPSAEERRAFEARVSARARRFDLRALVELLGSRGYPRESLLFEGNLEGGSSSLVHAVTFRQRPSTVVITVNMGLLGDSGLLPSYFLRLVERSADPDKFYDFIRFFDHVLIANYLAAVWPEDDPKVFGDYAAVRRTFLRMRGFSSKSSLHWLGQTIFPELGVRVSRIDFADPTEAHSFTTGLSLVDGTSVIGKVYEVDAKGFCVEIVAEEEVDSRGKSWATVVRARLQERMLPVLAPFRVPLMARLEVQSHASWARLAGPEQRPGFLGYDRLTADGESSHSILLYRGITGSNVQA